jgi:5-methylcytosine-specific restriction endonuclease McrA
MTLWVKPKKTEKELKEQRRQANLRYHQSEKGLAAMRKASAKYAKTDNSKISREKHKQTDLAKETRETYRKSERGKLSKRNASHIRRAREYNQVGPNPPTIEHLQELLKQPCAYCDQPSEHIDHIIPIAKGGLHDISNVVGACKPCNTSKKDKDLLTFLAERI